MKRPLILLLAATVALALLAASPAAAGDEVECESEAESGDVIANHFGVSSASSFIGGQTAVQSASQRNVQAGIFSTDSGSGSATTVVTNNQDVDQDVDQEVCTED